MPTGPGDVLQLIRNGHATTRGEVLDVTGLSRMTVAQRVDALMASRLVIEGRLGEIQVPLAAAICIEVNVDAKRIVIDPPEGLLELNSRQ